MATFLFICICKFWTALVPIVTNGLQESLQVWELEGNEAVQPRVLCFVDHTHPAAAQFFDDAIMRDGLADHCAEILGLGSRQVNSQPACGEGKAKVVRVWVDDGRKRVIRDHGCDSGEPAHANGGRTLWGAPGQPANRPVDRCVGAMGEGDNAED